MEDTAIAPKESPYYYGIDLGTSNSAICCYREGDVFVLKLDSQDTMPSVVQIDSKGEVIVGRQALNRALIEPERTIQSIKRKIGTPAVVEVDGKSYSPVDISAMILGKLVALAEEGSDGRTNGRPTQAVICVPANFTDNQKDDTKKAAEQAGLNVIALLAEPVSASIAYASGGKIKQTILVYDLGGGTFDVSVLAASNSGEDNGIGLKVMGKSGRPELGGDDFDAFIMKLIGAKLQEQCGFDVLTTPVHEEISTSKLNRARQGIKTAATLAKHALSTTETTPIDLTDLLEDGEGNVFSVEFELTRKEFEDGTRDLVDATIAPINEALEEAGLVITDIDKIVLVGGSTKMPIIRERLAELLGKEPWANFDVDTAVAQGAAIYAHDCSLPSQIPIEEKVTHFLGIETQGGDFDCIIEKGIVIPVGSTVIGSRTYQNAVDNTPSVIIRVYQTNQPISTVRQPEIVSPAPESISSMQLSRIGEFNIDIPKRPAGEVQIDVEFEIDQHNLLTVSASTDCGTKELVIHRN
ncbi:MAG TPA: Hsp70 family protein [Fimbriimonadaceae bacterium]|jgi:molecular chaperone DnaK (HSP70)